MSRSGRMPLPSHLAGQQEPASQTGVLSHTFVSLCPQGPWAVPGGGAGGSFLIFMHKAPLSPFSPALPPFLWPCCSQRWLLHPWSAPGAERGRGWCWLWGAPHVGAAGCSASSPSLKRIFQSLFVLCLLLSCSSALGMEGCCRSLHLW